MVHKPKHKVHSFRGLLVNGGQDEINLEKQNVNLAYRITKFLLFPYQVGNVTQESVCTIYKEEQTTVPTSGATTDLINSDILAVGALSVGSDEWVGSSYSYIIMDNVLFSRNIYVTHTDNSGEAVSLNYYIELEEVPVNAATLMQLKLGVARKLNLSESAPD